MRVRKNLFVVSLALSISSFFLAKQVVSSPTPVYSLGGGTTTSGSLKFGLTGVTLDPLGASVSGTAIVEDAYTGFSSVQGTLYVLVADDSTQAISQIATTSVPVLNSVHTQFWWDFSNIVIPAGKTFYGIRILGSCVEANSGLTKAIDGRIGAAFAF